MKNVEKCMNRVQNYFWKNSLISRSEDLRVDAVLKILDVSRKIEFTFTNVFKVFLKIFTIIIISVNAYQQMLGPLVSLEIKPAKDR